MTSLTDEVLRLGSAGVFVVLVVAAMIYDLAKFRIPNAISIALIALFGMAALTATDSVDWFGHLGAGLLLFAMGTILFSFRWLGGGDVKLLAAVSVWMGFSLLPAYLLLVGLIGGAFTIVLMLARVPLASSAPLWRHVGLDLPKVLRPGEAIPYGLAIGAAALIVSPRIPLLNWA